MKKTLRGEGTTKEFFGAGDFRASRIGGLAEDHQVNRSRLVKSLIRKATYTSHYRQTRQTGDRYGGHVNHQTDEEYVAAVKDGMISDFSHAPRRTQILKFIENVLSLRTAHNRRKAENGAGFYTLFSRRQAVYSDEDANVGVHFQPEGWKTEDGGKGVPKNAYSRHRLIDEDLNNDDWEQLTPMFEELLSISGLLNDLNSRAYSKNRLERECEVLMQIKQEYHAVDWEDEQRKDDEIQAWLDSAPSHAQLNHVAGSEDSRFRTLRGKRPTAQEIDSRKQQIEWKESQIKQMEEGLTKQIHLDHLDLDSLKGAEALKWSQIVDAVFGIGGEEE